ncbi:MAG: restriction endonuclease subunit S [Eubacteriales bacterium]
MSQWEMVRLGEVCGLNMGQSPESSSYNDKQDGLPFYQGNADFGDISPTTRLWCNSPKKIADCGELLLSVRAPVGAINIAAEKCCIGRGVASLIPNDNLDNKFFYHFLKSSTEKLNQKATGSTFKAINKSVLEEFPVPFPPLETQKHIAKTLDLATKLVDGFRQKLAELDLLVQSVFYEMFGDPVENEKGWDKRFISDFAEVGSCKRVFVDDLVEEGIPFYRGTEIGQLAVGNNIKPTLFITKEKYLELTAVSGVPTIGDLLMPSICSDGRIWSVNTEEPFYFKDGRVLRIFAFQPNVNSLYFLNALKVKFSNDYLKIASGTTFAELKIFALKQVEIHLPPLPLQEKFAEIVTKIEEEKAVAQRGLDEAESLLGGLMQGYFEG